MTNDTWSQWEELALSRAVPVQLVEENGQLDISAGQIWNAYWGEHEVLVFVAGSHPEAAEITAWPVTLEPGVEDEKCLILEAASSPLYADTALWDGLSRVLSTGVLDRVIGDLGIRHREATRAVLLSMFKGTRAGTHLWGSPQSATTLAIVDLEDSIDALSHAPRPQRGVQTGRASKLPIPMVTIMDTLDAAQPRAMAIILGKEPVSTVEAAELSEASGVPAEEILSHVQPLPPELEFELYQPRWRALVRKYMDPSGDEDVARRILGYEVYALAAREQGAGRALWRQRLLTIEGSKQVGG